MDDRKRNHVGQENAVDSLTGIFHRNGFYKATRALLDCRPNQTFCLLYWNINKFKVVNNLFGRAVGDRVLLQFAKTLQATFGETDAIYGRLERDNFICCVPEAILDDVQWQTLREISYIAEGSEYHFFSSSGLYRIEDPSLSVSDMVDKARIAMESVNGNFVASFAWYDESMLDTILEEQKLNSDFRTGIDEKQFAVYFQPICQASDGQIVGAEALVRWIHPERGLIPPNKFITLFEKNGFISTLDRYVWKETCQFLKSRLEKGLPVVSISLNVSRVEFYNPHLCEDLRDIVQQYGIPTDLIKIEVTESAYADNPRQVRDAVARFHQYGFVVLMDDFGSGYSSLNVLKDIDIDVLKIDMKFLDGFHQNRKATIILEAVIRMAKMMKLTVISEGVEAKGEWDFLKSVECDLVQGYLFYKPIPAADFAGLLDQVETVEYQVIPSDQLAPDDVIFDVFNQGDSRECTLFYSMLGGMGVLEMTGDSIEILQVNQGYYEAIYGAPKAPSAHGMVINKKVEPPARDVLMALCRTSMEEDRVSQAEFHYRREDGIFVWLEVKARYLGSRGKRSLFYFAVSNIDEMKKVEQKQYLQDYSAALIKVFDKVYRLDYDTGLAEVLHTNQADFMQVGEVYYFLDFFTRIKEYVQWMDNPAVAELVWSCRLLDQALDDSKNGTVSLQYRLCKNRRHVREVSALFFKIVLQDGKQEYLCCVKKR